MPSPHRTLCDGARAGLFTQSICILMLSCSQLFHILGLQRRSREATTRPGMWFEPLNPESACQKPCSRWKVAKVAKVAKVGPLLCSCSRPIRVLIAAHHQKILVPEAHLDFKARFLECHATKGIGRKVKPKRSTFGTRSTTQRKQKQEAAGRAEEPCNVDLDDIIFRLK